MMQSESIAKIAPALVAAQDDILAVEKSATNPHFKSKYVPLDALIAMARPAMRKHGIAIIQAGNPFDDGRGLLIETRLVHDSGEWISGVVYIPFGKADPQGAGAAMTYGRRFGLSALLGIVSEEDDDGNAASKPVAQKREAKPAAPKPAASGVPVWPFGDNKGQPLTKLTDDQLKSGLDWLKGKNDEAKFGKLIEQVETEMDARRNA